MSLEVATVLLARLLGGAIVVLGRQPGEPHDLGLQPLRPCRAALPMPHGVHPAAHGAPLASRGLGAGIGRHRQVGFGWHHKDDRVLVQPPEIATIQNAVINNHPMQSGVAGQIGPGLCHQGAGPEGLMLVHLDHLDGQENLGDGVDHEEHLPALDRHLDLARLAAHILDPDPARHVATPVIARSGLQISAVDNTGDHRAEDLGVRQRPDGPIEDGLQSAPVPLHIMLGERIRADRPRGPLALALGSPRWQMPWRTCWALKPTNCIKAVPLNRRAGRAWMLSMPKQGHQPIAQDILDAGQDLPWDSRTMHRIQQRHHAKRLQEVKKVIQDRPFVQPVDPIDQVLAVQTASDPGVVTTRDRLTQPLRHVRWDLVWCMPHRPPSSVACLQPIEESGHAIKAPAYVGTSAGGLGLTCYASTPRSRTFTSPWLTAHWGRPQTLQQSAAVSTRVA
jgi:hypothetical protein